MKFCFIETLFNSCGESLVNNLGSVYYIYAFVIIFSLSVLIAFRFTFKFHWTTILIAGILCVLFSLFVINYYRNGERMIELKSFGLKVVSCIETYKNEKNALPDSLGLLNNCFDPSEMEMAKNVVKYSVFKKEELNKPYKDEKPYKEDKFSLTIYEDFLGFYHLAYREKEKRFIYTDD